MHKTKHLHAKLFLFLFFVSITFTIDAQTTLRDRLEKHVFTLASDSLQGRKAGTAYAQKAAAYVSINLAKNGLDKLILQPFGRNHTPNRRIFRNVIGVLHGNDPILRYEYIVVGAHFDHLGVREDGAIYSGADDNASGVAVLIELARMLRENQSNLKRSVIFVGFDAEEIGLIGSTDFARRFNDTFPNGNIVLMLSLDMVGWYAESGMVEHRGTRTIRNGCTLILNPQLIPEGLNVVARGFETSLRGATDTQPFAVRGIPTIHVTTGLLSPFHQPEDEAHLIDLDGMVLITEHLSNLIEFIAQDTQFAASGRVSRLHRVRSRVEFGASANIGNNFHHYTAGALDGKSATSFGVGLMSQVNIASLWGIRPEVHFERIRGHFPGGTIATNNITIPLSLVFQTAETKNIMSPNRMIRLDTFLGGYYTHRLSGTMGGEQMDFENTFNREEWGLTWGFGLEFRPFRTRIGFTNRSSLTNLMQMRNEDGASLRNRSNFLTLTYIF